MRSLDLTDKEFFDLKVVRLSNVNRNKGRYWECICKCGISKTFSTDHLTRKKNPVKSCGCKQITRGPDHAQWKGYGGISRSWWLLHVDKEFKGRRKQVKVNIDIKYGWELFLKQGKKCALSGVDLQFGLRSEYNTASLDRIDSSKGYEIGNVQWVHKHVNFMKRDFEQQYFIDFCKKIVELKG